MDNGQTVQVFHCLCHLPNDVHQAVHVGGFPGRHRMKVFKVGRHAQIETQNKSEGGKATAT